MWNKINNIEEVPTGREFLFYDDTKDSFFVAFASLSNGRLLYTFPYGGVTHSATHYLELNTIVPKDQH